MPVDLFKTMELIFNSSLLMLGVLLALYSLVFPVRKQILNVRLEEYKSKKTELNEVEREWSNPNQRTEELESKKEELKGEVAVLKRLPSYFDGGILISSIFFIISGIFAWFSINEVSLTSQSGSYSGALLFFFGGILAFLITSGRMFFDTRKATQNWYGSVIDEMDKKI